MPMRTVGKRHIVTEKDDLSRTELHREVQSMKSSVAAPSYAPQRFKNDFLQAGRGPHPMNFWEGFDDIAILGDFQALERSGAVVVSPPCAVAGVEDAGPGGDPVSVVDGDAADLRRPRKPKFDSIDARTSGDADDNFIGTPPWEP